MTTGRVVALDEAHKVSIIHRKRCVIQEISLY
jgi:hypothetical protein